MVAAVNLSFVQWMVINKRLEGEMAMLLVECKLSWTLGEPGPHTLPLSCKHQKGLTLLTLEGGQGGEQGGAATGQLVDLQQGLRWNR